jgi:hypothetical protein
MRHLSKLFSLSRDFQDKFQGKILFSLLRKAQFPKKNDIRHHFLGGRATVLRSGFRSVDREVWGYRMPIHFYGLEAETDQYSWFRLEIGFKTLLFKQTFFHHLRVLHNSWPCDQTK